MNDKTLTAAEIADLRSLAGMIVPPSAKYGVPSADDETAGELKRVNGMGTGVVVDARGYVVTNYTWLRAFDASRSHSPRGRPRLPRSSPTIRAPILR